MKKIVLTVLLVLGMIGVASATDCHQNVQAVTVAPLVAAPVVQYYSVPVPVVQNVQPVVAVPHVNYQTVLQIAQPVVQYDVQQIQRVQKVRERRSILGTLRNRREAVKAAPIQKNVIVRERIVGGY